MQIFENTSVRSVPEIASRWNITSAWYRESSRLGEGGFGQAAIHHLYSSSTRRRSSNSSLSISPRAKRSLRISRGVLPGVVGGAAPYPPPSQRNIRTTAATMAAMNTIIISGPKNIHHPPPHMCGPWYGQSCCCAQAADDTVKVLIGIAAQTSKFFIIYSFSLNILHQHSG